MRRIQIIRITLLLAAIFVAGAVTGRLTVESRSAAPTSLTTLSGRTMTASAMLDRMARSLKLDAAQGARIRPILEEAVEASSKVPPASQERFDIFRRCMARVRDCLRPDQYPEFDRTVRMKERQFERMLRDRGKEAAPATRN